MMVAWPRAGMAPMTLYCGPGPERILSGIIAAASVAAEADADIGAIAATDKMTMLLMCMTVLLVLNNFVTPAARASSSAARSSAARATILSKFPNPDR